MSGGTNGGITGTNEGTSGSPDGDSNASPVPMDGSIYAPSPTGSFASSLVNNRLLKWTNGGLEIGSQTLAPGTSTTMDNHVTDYANPSQVIEDGVTHNLAPESSTNPLVLSGQTLLRATNDGLITAGTTIAPGSTAAIGVVTARPSTSSNTLQKYVLPNGASLSAGGSAAVYSGTTYSALPSNAGIVAAGPSGSSTLAIPTIPPTATQSMYTAAGATFTPQPSGFAIGGTSLAPGGQALTTSGTVIGLGTSGTFIVASSTIILPSQSVFTAAGAAFTAQATGFELGTTSLSPSGAAYTTDGTVISPQFGPINGLNDLQSRSS
ncbi:MAG: hypothetical protein Q9175_008023, partial [Cornicularia normoerica]